MLIFSCQENEFDQLATPVDPAQNHRPDVSDQAKFGKLICFYDIEWGRRIYFPPTNSFICLNLSGICRFRKLECVWIEIPIFDPCQFVPCWDILDPWDIYTKFDPDIFTPLIDLAKERLDPKTTVTPFAVAKKVIGLQYYNDIDETLNKEVMIFEEDFALEPELMELLGMEGTIIPAGKYPVIYNEKGGTFNVLATVK